MLVVHMGVFLFRAVTKHFGANTGRLTLCFLIFGSGMFVAGTAFIPSTFAMYLVTLAVAGWFTNQLSLAVFGIAAAAIVGWPFAAALGLVFCLWPVVLGYCQLTRVHVSVFSTKVFLYIN